VSRSVEQDVLLSADFADAAAPKCDVGWSPSGATHYVV